MPHPQSEDWRLVLSGYGRGAWNMSVDEAILWAHAGEMVPPTLRIYQWSPPTVSLGYSQRVSDVDLDRCREAGYDVVRRPTGGKAILHNDEITYSVVIREELLPDDRSVVGAYRWISRGLTDAFRLLGVPVGFADEQCPSDMLRGDFYRRRLGAACFSAPARCDMVYEGKKIVGSAQVRRNGCVLQHGSIPLSLHRELIGHLITSAGDVGESIALGEVSTATTVSCDRVAESLISGFASALGIKFTSCELVEEESRTAHHLHETKYAKLDWSWKQRGESTDKGRGGAHRSSESAGILPDVPPAPLPVKKEFQSI